MHTIEASVIFSIIIIFISNFINFTMKLERNISKYVKNEYILEVNQYSKDGDKKYKPETIQRIITNIENFGKEYNNGNN